MTQFTLDIQGFKPLFGEINLDSAIQYYRVPHDIERVNVDKDDFRFRGNGTYGTARTVLDVNGEPIKKRFPEVYRLHPDHHTVLDCSLQLMWRNLNPLLSAQKWSTLLGNKLAWTNGSGFPGHYNCITGADKDKPFPRFDQPRVCGGTYLRGIESDGKLFIYTMISASPIIWYYGISVAPDGKVYYITREGIDGKFYEVKIPLLTTLQVWIPLDELHKWPLGKPLESATYIL